MKLLQSIRVRLLLFSLIGTVAAVAVATGGLVTLFGRHVERRVEQELDAHIATLAGNLRSPPDGSLQLAREPSDRAIPAAVRRALLAGAGREDRQGSALGIAVGCALSPAGRSRCRPGRRIRTRRAIAPDRSAR